MGGKDVDVGGTLCAGGSETPGRQELGLFFPSSIVGNKCSGQSTSSGCVESHWNRGKKEKCALYPLIKEHSQNHQWKKSIKVLQSNCMTIKSHATQSFPCHCQPSEPHQAATWRTVENMIIYRIMVMQGHRAHDYLCFLILSISYSSCAVYLNLGFLKNCLKTSFVLIVLLASPLSFKTLGSSSPALPCQP